MNMNELKIFESTEFGKIRAVKIEGEPWFVGKDVASALGYSDTADALKKHVDEEDKRLAKPGELPTLKTSNYGVYIINESGLYSLILSSKLPGAKKFKRWVTSEVLPAIRKTGRYFPEPLTEYQKTALSIQEKNAHIQAAALLTQIAGEYEGTYRQILQAYATKELVGEFALPLPKAERLTHTAGEIGKRLGISANKVGQLANKHGLKTEKYGAWFLDKSPYSNKEVETFRYFDSVIPVLEKLLGT